LIQKFQDTPLFIEIFPKEVYPTPITLSSSPERIPVRRLLGNGKTYWDYGFSTREDPS
jgi:hypothetical protein